MTFGNITATLVKRGAGPLDRHNNPTFVELSTIELAGCDLQQRDTSEYHEQRDSTDTGWILFAPAPALPELVTTVDLIRIDAEAADLEPDPGETFATFTIDGDPDYLIHETDGTTHHLELVLGRLRL